MGFLFFQQKSEKEIKISKWLIIIPIIIILFSRIIPLLGNKVPLGYDTGIYKKFIEDFAEALPNLPDFNSGKSVIQEPIGLYLIADLLHLLGFNGNQILFGFCIFFDLLLGLGIYSVVKKYFNLNAAILAFFVFSISITQFQTYYFLYYKNILALFLMLMVIWLLKEKSYLVIPVAAFLGGVHQMTFFIFGLTMFITFVFSREKKYYLISGFFILILAVSFYIKNPGTILNLLPEINIFSLISSSNKAYSGRFFDFSVYTQIAAFYLIFSVLGFIHLIKEKRFDYLFFWYLLNLLIIFSGFYFYNRFIVHFDIIAAILAGFAISLIINKVLPTGYGQLAVLFFVLGTIYFLFNNVLSTKPLISKEELAEIRSLEQTTEENAFLISSISHYSPWLFGYSGRKIIAPGMFEYDTKWTEEEWYIFWQTENQNIRQQLLDRYKRPLYIFVGDIDPYQLKFKFSSDPSFQKISQRVFQYKK